MLSSVLSTGYANSSAVQDSFARMKYANLVNRSIITSIELYTSLVPGSLDNRSFIIKSIITNSYALVGTFRFLR